MAAKSDSVKTKKIKKSFNKLELKATSKLSNTFMTLTNNGDVVYTVSCGKLQIKGSKKNTPYAIEKLCDNITRALKDMNVKHLDIDVKGNFSANFLSRLDGHGFIVDSIRSMTAVPHGGVRIRREKRK